MALGVVLAATFYELLNLKSATRSATIGVILISLTPAGKYFYEIAFDRAIKVAGGCVIAMLLTFVMHALVIRFYKPAQKLQATMEERRSNQE